MPPSPTASIDPVIASIVTAGIMLGCFLLVWALRAKSANPGAKNASGTDEQTNALTRALINELDQRAEKLSVLVARAEAVEQRLSEQSPPLRTPPKDLAAASFLEEDPANLRIFELADQGRSMQEIAAILERPSGQIELVLNLRRTAQRG